MKDDNFWGRVKILLRAHKMTQKQFAEYLGVSVNTLTGWIRYERIPDTGTAYDMAIVLGVTLNYLLGGREAEIADWRLKELAARDAAARIMELLAQIQQETRKLRPLTRIGAGAGLPDVIAPENLFPERSSVEGTESINENSFS